MFSGEYSYKIDPKGRVNMPSKYRDKLGEKFYITKGFDSCLFVYPEDEWIELDKKIKDLSIANKNARAFSRIFLAGAVESSMDKQGRVNLSKSHLEFADIKKDVQIIGVSKRIEIWSKEKWDNYTTEFQNEFDNIAEGIENLGI